MGLKENIQTITDAYGVTPDEFIFYIVGPKHNESIQTTITGQRIGKLDSKALIEVNTYNWTHYNNGDYRGIKARVMPDLSLNIPGYNIDKDFSGDEQSMVDKSGIELTSFAESLLNDNANSLLDILYNTVNPEQTKLQINRVIYKKDDSCTIFISTHDVENNKSRWYLTINYDLNTKSVSSLVDCYSDDWEEAPISLKQYCDNHGLNKDNFGSTVFDYANTLLKQI